MDNHLFRELVDSIKEMKAIEAGKKKASRTFKFNEVDVKAIREGIGVSQSDFAYMIGVSVDTVQNWEQGRCRPAGPAKALLRAIRNDPEAIVRALMA